MNQAIRFHAEHVKQVTEMERQRNFYFACLAGGLLVLLFAFTWLCLHYQKSDLLITLVAALFTGVGGGLGGYGIGRANKGATPPTI